MSMPRLRGVALASLPVFVFSVVLAASIFIPGAVPAARAHDTTTLLGHIEEDSVPPLAPATQRQYERHTSAASAPDAAAAAATVTGDAGQVGQWGPVVDWPVVAVHMALLPNGKVLAYDSMGDNATESYPVQDHTRATVWDPATGAQTPVNVATGYNIFCSGLAHLMDGSLFVAGGTKDPQLDGIVQTHFFDPKHQYVEPGAEHGGWTLVSERHPPVQRGDADHLGRTGHAGGAQDRRWPARAQHGLAQPAAVSVDRRGAQWPCLLLGSRPDDAEPRHSRRRLVAGLRPARHSVPRLRQPRPL